MAINLSRIPSGRICGISRSFPRLSRTPGQVPTRYSPVRHSPRPKPAFDLHVLSMPPAFVLSQDQTLRFNPDKPAILSDDRPVVQRPGPAQSTRPNKGHQTLMRKIHPTPNTLQAPDQTVPRPRDRQPMPPPAHPFIHQQCQSATPPPRPPPGSLPQETRRRGRTLIWPPLPHRQAPLKTSPTPNTPNHQPPHSKPKPRNSPSNHSGNPFPPRLLPLLLPPGCPAACRQDDR